MSWVRGPALAYFESVGKDHEWPLTSCEELVPSATRQEQPQMQDSRYQACPLYLAITKGANLKMEILAKVRRY